MFLRQALVFLTSEILQNRLDEANQIALSAHDSMTLKGISDPENLKKVADSWFNAELARRMLEGLRSDTSTLQVVGREGAQQLPKELGRFVHSLVDTMKAAGPIGQSFIQKEELVSSQSGPGNLKSLRDAIEKTLEAAGAPDDVLKGVQQGFADSDRKSRELTASLHIGAVKATHETVVHEISNRLDVFMAEVRNTYDTPTEQAFGAGEIIVKRFDSIVEAVTALPEIAELLKD